MNLRTEDFMPWWEGQVLARYPALERPVKDLPEEPTEDQVKAHQKASAKRLVFIESYRRALQAFRLDVLDDAIQDYMASPKGRQCPSVFDLVDSATEADAKRRGKQFSARDDGDENLPDAARRERQRMLCLSDFIFNPRHAVPPSWPLVAYVEYRMRLRLSGDLASFDRFWRDVYPLASRGRRSGHVGDTHLDLGFVLARRAGIGDHEAGVWLARADHPPVPTLPDGFILLPSSIILAIGYVAVTMDTPDPTTRAERWKYADEGLAAREAGMLEDSSGPQF